MTGYIRQVTQLDHSLGRRLPYLDLELTERCDNDCIHCCINRAATDDAARAQEMPTEQVKELLNQAALLGCLQVRITGGEPLLRPDFEEIYVHARKRGMQVRLFTNARRITPSLAGLWARMPPLVPIEVTVYGMRRESYEAVSRAPGSFAEFRHGVDLLLETGVPFIVKGALLAPNRAEMTELEDWASTNVPAMNGAVRYSMLFDLRHRRDDCEKNRLIRMQRVSPVDALAVLTRDKNRYRRNAAEFASKYMGPRGDRLFDCGAGQSICVDAYGRVQPCLSLRAPELTISFPEVSLSSALDRFQEIKNLRATSPDYLRRCARCQISGLCEQCPAKSWAESGTLDTPVEYLCEFAHQQAWYLGWLEEGERAWERETLGCSCGQQSDSKIQSVPYGTASSEDPTA